MNSERHIIDNAHYIWPLKRELARKRMLKVDN